MPPARTHAPALFRLAKYMERKQVRGSTRLLRILNQVGYLDRPVDFPLGGSVTIRVPIARNDFDAVYLAEYEEDLFVSLASEIERLPAPVTLVDVGADIGLFSLKILARCPSISHVIAFEPNSEGFQWLRQNLERLPDRVQAQSSPVAIADFRGRGRLGIPAPPFTMQGVNHTQYFLEPASDGPLEVTTIDALELPVGNSTLIKIDVEGGEAAVLRGAVKTIREASNCLIVFEAHPLVVERTGIDPVECLRVLEPIRPFRFFVSENGLELTTGRAFFEQIKPDRVYNVIARSI